jgi:hypothetical protein
VIDRARIQRAITRVEDRCVLFTAVLEGTASPRRVEFARDLEILVGVVRAALGAMGDETEGGDAKASG